MKYIIERNKAKVPGMINGLLDETVKPGLSKDKREEQYFILERLAAVYRDVTGDASILNAVNKSVFESRLTPSVVSTPESVSKRVVSLYVVETVFTETLKNVFRPDNMIIKAGDSVRWVNNGTSTHVLASALTSMGRGGIFSPVIEPGQSWEYTFNSPGEYFYVCFSHKVMYGKILVKE
jgi:plastocyanin